jgi:Divergent InlB B-repeat domain
VRRLLLLVVLLGGAAALWSAPGAFAAGWCGSGETPIDRPDVVTGRQVHAVLAVPADAPDTFDIGAGKLADDLASITTWWAVQDPTRVPRIDDASFPAGACTDISFVRLPLPASAYDDANRGYVLIANALGTAGLGSAYKKYLVYYDGPSVEPNVCGTGAGLFDTGPSYAIVWLAGCPEVPTDSIAAHELLHTLGALPAGAPHACPGDAGHPCDSTQDVLYPYTAGGPLSQELLDVGHDDYYGHGGSWLDIQDSPWLHLLGAPVFPVSVTFAGAGTVRSDVPGIECSSTCTTQWDGGSTLQLTAVPTPGERLVRWSGGCAGLLECVVRVDAATSVTASFGPTRIPLTLRESGRGAIACTPRCGSSFPGGKPLTLRGVPAKGWRFVSWSGDCAGASTATCRPKTDYRVSVSATFRRR